MIPIKNKTKLMLQIEKQHGENIEEILLRKYVDEGKSEMLCAEELNVKHRFIRKCLNLMHITTKRLELNHKKYQLTEQQKEMLEYERRKK